MGKLDKFDVTLDNPDGVFEPGHVVSGLVHVEVNDEMKMRGIRIKFHGGADVHWTEHHHISTGNGTTVVIRYYNNKQKYFDEEIVVFGKAKGEDGDDYILTKGSYTYKFEFTLPQKLPSSFEGEWGRVRYWLQGIIDRPWKFDHKCKKPFTLVGPVDLNKLSNMRAPQTAQADKTLCCLCCKSGPITASLRLDRKGYVSGEFVTIHGEITNLSNKVMKSSAVELRMTTVFRATTKKRRSVRTLSKVTKGEIAEGESESWTGERLYIPPLPPSQLPNCDIIHISYRVVMVVDPSGPSYDLEAPIEITVGTVPLRDVPYVLSKKPSDYTLPFTYADLTSEYKPPQPVIPSEPAMPPPAPVYAESVFGRSDVKDRDDNQYTRGETVWAPRYATYTWGMAG